MNKNTLSRFINKIHFGNVIEDAIWQFKDKALQVQAMTSDRKLFIHCKWNYFLDYVGADTAIGIQQVRKILKLLKTLPSDIIRFEVVADENGGLDTLKFSDDNRQFFYHTTNLDMFDPVPKMKNIPPWTVAIKFTDGLKDWFLRSFSAIGDKHSLFYIGCDESDGKLQIGIGNNCIYEPETVDGLNTIGNTTHFSAFHLAKILQANREFRNPILYASDVGLSHIAFTGGDELESTYYMVKIDYED